MDNREWNSKHVIKQVVREFYNYAGKEDLCYCMERVCDLVDDGYFDRNSSYNNRMRVLRDLLKERGCNVPLRIGYYKFIEKEETDE